MKSSVRTLFFAFLDLVLIQVAGLTAIGLRFDFSWPLHYLVLFEGSFPLLAAVRLGIYSAFGLYSRVWRYSSVPELRAIMMAGTMASAFDSLFLHVFRAAGGFPRSATLLTWVFNIALAGGLRLSLRMRQELYEARSLRGPRSARARQGVGERLGQPRRRRSKVLLVGAGQAGWLATKELNSHPELPLAPVGFLDDDPAKQGGIVGGLRVLGPVSELPRVVRRLGVNEVIVCMPSAPGPVVKHVVDLCKSIDVGVRTLPGVYEVLDGTVTLSRVRPIDISDLLRREEVRLDPERAAGYLRRARVMVTGAGGSIGSELCRQIARATPAQLILLGHGEHSIHETLCELQHRFKYLNVVPVIADVRDTNRIDAVFAEFRPEVVFHAAAHKHVYLMQLNPEEAFTTNVVGTWAVARAADAHGALRFVLISTDKAADPVSVMGATKQAAEVVVRLFNQVSPTKFIAVRFGNVLGSRGSVIPVFKQQIAWGGPVTVTDPGMKRYFMTIPEATQLVLQAAAIGEGGEVFVLDMGDPVSILDMARDLIRLSGLEPDRDMKIEFSGARPGEKLVERLTSEAETLVPTEHARILRVQGPCASPFWARMRSGRVLQGDGLGSAVSGSDVWNLALGYREAAATCDRAAQGFVEWISQFAPGGRYAEVARREAGS